MIALSAQVVFRDIFVEPAASVSALVKADHVILVVRGPIFGATAPCEPAWHRRERSVRATESHGSASGGASLL